MNIKRFDNQLFNQLAQDAQNSPRQRANANVHQDLNDNIQRLFISMTPQSYVRPHRHSNPAKWEFFLMVSGKVSFLLFDDDGVLLERIELDADSTNNNKGLELPAHCWHSIIAQSENATFLEVKQGPYQPLAAQDFASWAPAEGDQEVTEFMQQLNQLSAGQRVNYV
ncbi:WbuC family cupin fold metalloprotein [Neptunicella marina]|uniref:WbuC family cupin fold metalloprotein n=1 Tax=Neptunicella marina TaxID=2125989 RepID=A0A8J6IRS8_9ALTE|nr:WbuC family cupin fold metalloprotein [Neptunicella marina]MBC3765089.1 WbuC family cupin fold metalloprotein [Neptunicella marina]